MQIFITVKLFSLLFKIILGFLQIAYNCKKKLNFFFFQKTKNLTNGNQKIKIKDYLFN